MPEQQSTADDTAVNDVELDDTAEDTEDGDIGTEQQDAWTPPTREEWEASQAKLKRANDQARRLREKAKTPATGEQPSGVDAAELSKWQTRAVRTAAKAELLARGADPDMVDLALGRLKPGEVDFDDDDRPELDDWLDDMEDRYPKLFAKPAPAVPAPRPRTGRIDQGAAATPPRPRLSLGEQIISNAKEAAKRGARP